MTKRRRKPSSLPGRILARLLLVLLGFFLGVALFTPWNKIWASALTRLDENLPMVGLTWENIDRDGPFGFRVNDFRIAVAKTPGALRFRHAYVTVGFAPLAKVRLDTHGTQCFLELYSNGIFEFSGDLNLTYLLGQGDFKGTLNTSGSLFMPDGARLPKNGWLDIRSQQLILPGERSVEDLAFTAAIEGNHLDIRDFSLRRPITYKSAGVAVIDPDNFFQTLFSLAGEMTVGNDTFPYEMKGTLAQALW
ncbi:MAG: hypothetical protein H0S80_09000 [Desulfovibrionaceae bacterium]|nr:hypothetical protein [Desulfovibrionaceae bacterium]